MYPHGVLQVWVASLLIVGQCFTVMAAPLLLEFTVEICYPVSEVISGGASFLGYGRKRKKFDDTCRFRYFYIMNLSIYIHTKIHIWVYISIECPLN